MPASRASTLVKPDDPIVLTSAPPRFVSRGGEKLDHALEHLNVGVADRRWLDAGASTGGFTDRLLQGGALGVVAADVGYGQFDWSLRNDPRVVVLERTNVRELTIGELPWVPDGVVADLSFISLRSVIPNLVTLAAEDADHIYLVKPQFEVGRADAGKGVVRDPALWTRAIEGVIETAGEQGLALVDAVLAEPPGPSGNREFFVHLCRGGGSGRDVVAREVGRAEDMQTASARASGEDPNEGE